MATTSTPKNKQRKPTTPSVIQLSIPQEPSLEQRINFLEQQAQQRQINQLIAKEKKRADNLYFIGILLGLAIGFTLGRKLGAQEMYDRLSYLYE